MQSVVHVPAERSVRFWPLSERPEMISSSSLELVFCTVAVYLTVEQMLVVAAGPGVVFAELGASEEVTLTKFDVPEIDVLDMSPTALTLIWSVISAMVPTPRFSTFGVALNWQIAPGVVWTVDTSRSNGPLQVLVPASIVRVPAGQAARLAGADADL